MADAARASGMKVIGMALSWVAADELASTASHRGSPADRRNATLMRRSATAAVDPSRALEADRRRL